jgi:diacylglycerol kinase (CTP)
VPERPQNDPELPPATGPSATRKDLQLGRRLVHALNGTGIATAYALLLTHRQLVHVFGTVACLVYILDRVRMHYPELVQRAPWINRLFFRAEEELRESAMTPYAVAILLTILTFPKLAALIAIYTLALADPLAAIVGITWGRRRLASGKTLEGSLAFFGATLAVTLLVLSVGTDVPAPPRVTAGLLIALAGAACELLPLRIDDNLTIPLVVGFASWAAGALAGVPLQ